MHKIIIVGSSGYIGKELVAHSGLGRTILGTSSSGLAGRLPLDLRKPQDFDTSVIAPGDCLIVTAAISNPDRCANDYAQSYAINVTGSIELLSRVMDRGARVLFLSSDTVYGAAEVPVAENSACQPIGAYGEMKFAVEEHFRRCDDFKVARLSYVFSREDKFSQYLSGCAARAEVAEIFHPFVRNVIYRGDVIEGLLRICTEWERCQASIYNFGGPEPVSRLEIAQQFQASFFPELEISVVEPEEDFFKARPKFIRMTSHPLRDVLGRPQLSIKQAIDQDFGIGEIL